MYEYLPSLLGEEYQPEPYGGYKPDVHPGISISFQSAAFRQEQLLPCWLFFYELRCKPQWPILKTFYACKLLTFTTLMSLFTFVEPLRVAFLYWLGASFSIQRFP